MVSPVIVVKWLALLLFSKLAGRNAISLPKYGLQVVGVAEPNLLSDDLDRQRGVSQKSLHFSKLDPEDFLLGATF